MIALPAGTGIWIAAGVTDMRRGFHGLIAQVQTYVRDDRPSGHTSAPAVWFAYSSDRRGENPRQHLKHYKSALQADAFAGFQQLYEGGTINEVACWAHARRKFHEIHIAHASPTTAEAIERIATLYAIEAEIRGSTPEVRRSVRQARAKPLLDSMRPWMEDTIATLSRKSDTAAAIRYATSRWQALTRYVDDGHLEIDTQAGGYAEREAALLMLEDQRKGRRRRITVGADKAYDTKDFIAATRASNVTAHVTKNDKGRRSNLDRRTTRHPGYAISLSRRWLIEKGFGWLKQTGPMRQVKLRGLHNVDWLFVFSCAAHNLMRLPKLIALQPQARPVEQCA